MHRGCAELQVSVAVHRANIKVVEWGEGGPVEAAAKESFEREMSIERELAGLK